MFVSSYSTYIQTNGSNKSAKHEIEKQGKGSSSFSSKLLDGIGSVSYKTSNISINYISNTQVLNNQKELELQNQQLKNPQDNPQNILKENINRFTQQNSLKNAKNAYDNNSKMFSLIRKPLIAFDQTPRLENRLPKEPQKIIELNMRHKMVNTYIANDAYYKVTA